MKWTILCLAFFKTLTVFAQAGAFQMDVAARTTYVSASEKSGLGPSIKADYGISKRLRVGGEIAMPILSQKEGLPANITAYLMFNFLTKNPHLIPYFYVPVGVSIAMGRIPFLAGIHTGLRWYFSDHVGAVLDGACEILILGTVNFNPSLALGLSFRF